MARSVIDLIFQATDKASGTANKIGNAVDGINSKASASVGKAAALGVAFAGAFAAVQVAASLASNAIGFIGTRITEASSANQSLISTTGTLSSVLDIPFKQAGMFVDQMNDSIFKATNVLPGATEEYIKLGNSIIDNLIPAAKSAEGILDPKKLIAITTAMSQNFGLIGKSSGVGQQDVTKGLGRAIGGGSLKELEDLMLFTENPALLNKLKEQLTKRGVSELKDLDQKARIDILNLVGGSLISPETKAALVDTLDARIEGLMSTLFDPKRGVFGFLNDIDSRGGKNVLDAVTKAFDSVMGIFNKIAEAFGKGGGSDTAALEIIFDFFSSISDVANMISGGINVEALSLFFDAMSGFFTAIQDAANRVISGDLMAAIDLGMYAQMLGENWANGIMDWISSIDWASVLIGLGRILIVMGFFASNFVAGFASALNARVAEMYVNAVNTIVYGIKGTFDSIAGAISSAFSSVASKVNAFFASLPSLAQQKLNEVSGGLVPAPTAANNMSGYSTSSMSVGGDNFYITINTGANPNNVGTFADELVRQLDAKWSQYKGARFNNAGLAL